MTDSWDPRACLDLAKRADAPPDELSRMSRSPHVFVLEAVAMHPKTPAVALSNMVPADLLKDDGFRVAGALLLNENLPIAALQRIADSTAKAISEIVPRVWYARQFLCAFAANPNANVEILRALLDPKIAPRHIREWIARNSRRRDVLETLAHDPSGTVSKLAARRLKAIID